MSIIQISKIQQRSGDLVDLPQLDEAEFGFASDEKRLFIGKTLGSSENIEVLTAYSEISFDQIEGATGNLNIDSATLETGQILAYDGTNWVNAGGNALQPGNASYYTNTPIHLGNITDVNIGGGAIGYVMTTDGAGGLSWSPKGLVTQSIQTISQAATARITFTQPYPFPQGVEVTINGITSPSGFTILNGNNYFLKIVPGNLQLYDLYTDSGLSIPVNSSAYTPAYTSNGIAIFNTVTSNGGLVAGSQYSVQYNTGTDFGGDTNFTWNYTTTTLAITGSATISGNANVGNLGTSGLVVATGNVTGGNLVTSGALSVTGNANVGNIGAARGVFTSNVSAGNLSTSGALSVTGNANVGNLGTSGLIVATGNITGGNLSTAGVLTVTGNATVGNLITTVITTGANTTAGTITGNWTLSSGSRLIATYADLAEYYAADKAYVPGTVLEFGGEKEVTLATVETSKLAGVVSTLPSYVMNGDIQTEFPTIIALIGRVPVNVVGTVNKGDMLVSAGNGLAKVSHDPKIGTVIGKAIGNKLDDGEGIVEVMVGRM